MYMIYIYIEISYFYVDIGIIIYIYIFKTNMITITTAVQQFHGSLSKKKQPKKGRHLTSEFKMIEKFIGNISFLKDDSS